MVSSCPCFLFSHCKYCSFSHLHAHSQIYPPSPDVSLSLQPTYCHCLIDTDVHLSLNTVSLSPSQGAWYFSSHFPSPDVASSSVLPISSLAILCQSPGLLFPPLQCLLDQFFPFLTITSVMPGEHHVLLGCSTCLTVLPSSTLPSHLIHLSHRIQMIFLQCKS